MGAYLVTGATRGIGRGVVELLADHDLYLMANRDGPLDELCASLPSATGRAVDLAQPERIEAAVAGWLPEHLDGIVHSAGVSPHGPLADETVAEWTRALAVNVVSVAELTRVCLPALRAGGATVVLVNSGSGRRVSPGGVCYSATKFALRAYADGLRQEETALRVTTFMPGRVDTDMQRATQDWLGRLYRPEDHLRVETVAPVIVAALMLPPDGVMTEVAVRPWSDS